MSMNLMFEATTPRDYAGEWATITAISKTDPASPYPNEGYVFLDADVIVAAAALLDGTRLVNGETITTYDFSHDDGEKRLVDAHVKAFGPSLLPAEKLEALRTLMAGHPHAVRMLEVVIDRNLQILLSSTDMMNRAMPHLKGVNWIADEVEINRCKSSMLDMIDDLGLSDCNAPDGNTGEVEFDRFAHAVNDNGHLSARLQPFVECAKRNGAAKVYWA